MAGLLPSVRLARGVEPYDSPKCLLSQICAIFEQCVDLPRPYTLVLASFVLATWVIERLPVAPYVAIVGLHESGKSTLLRILSLLCRRSILTADITHGGFYEVCDRLTPTLIIDEADTAGHHSNLSHLLKVGFTPDLTAIRWGQSFKAFGPKVVGGQSYLKMRPLIVDLLSCHYLKHKRLI